MSKVLLPYTEDCFVCGESNPHGLHLKFSYENGEATAHHTPPPEKCGYPGIVHGGVLSAMLDETMAWSPAYQKRRMCVAADLHVRFLKPVPVGTPLIIRGRLTEDKRLFWKCEGSIEDREGTVYATGRATYVPLTTEEGERIERETLIYPEGTSLLFSRKE